MSGETSRRPETTSPEDREDLRLFWEFIIALLMVSTVCLLAVAIIDHFKRRRKKEERAR